jgi:hypothetical protein
MSAAMRVETKTNTDGKLDYLTVYRKGRKAVHLHFVYGQDGFLSDIEFTGKKEDMPDIPSIIELINEKFMERIGIIEDIDLVKLITRINLLDLITRIALIDRITLIDAITSITNILNLQSVDLIDAITNIVNIQSIDLIDLITKIGEITVIKNIETIGNMPDPTPKGSQGMAFKQTAPDAGDVGAWVSPTGFEAGSGWGNEAMAYDENLALCAAYSVPLPGWSAFLVLTIAATTSRSLRFYGHSSSIIDVDVFKDGAWVHVYEGAYAINTWVEKTFSQGSVTKARVRMYGDIEVVYLCEFDFWRVAGSGGTGGVMMVAGSYLTPTLYNVTMTNADTEYHQDLPDKTKRFSIKTRDGTAFRVAFGTGFVATPTPPYETVPANWHYWEDLLYVTGLTLYFGCGSAGKIVEITVWT